MRKIYVLIVVILFVQVATAQWHKREVKYQSSSFFPAINAQDIHFSDSSNGMLVGPEVILQYKNAKWTPVPGIPVTPGFLTVFTVNPTNTFMGGNEGLLMKYDGSRFTRITTGVSNLIRNIFMIDSANGWAVGYSGLILRLWHDTVTRYPIDQPYLFQNVHFDKPDHGWAVGHLELSSQGSSFISSAIFEYANDNWKVHTRLDESLLDIEFTDSGKGFIAGLKNLYGFNPLNNTWSVIPTNNTDPEPLWQNISMANDSFGICIGWKNNYMVFDNGVWTTHQTDIPDIIAAKCFDKKNIWAVSTIGSSADPNLIGNNTNTVLRYNKSGWQPFPLHLDTARIYNADFPIHSVSTFGKKHVRLEGLPLDLPPSTDWPDSIPVLPEQFRFVPARLFNEKNSWGHDGYDLVHIEDGRYSPITIQEPYPSDTLNFPVDMHMFSDTTAYLAGIKDPGFGLDFATYIDYYEKSTLKKKFNIPTSKLPLSLHFANKRHGWCVGDSGLLVKYDHGNWEIKTPPTKKTLLTVFSIDSVNAWCAGANGTVFKYDGSNWIPSPIGTTSNINALFFSDKKHGWAVGDEGLIFKYNGTAWVKDTSITSHNLFDIVMVDSKFGWAVGDSGTVLQYIDTTTTVDSTGGRPALANISSMAVPNFSNSNITISFELPEPGNTSITIFNQNGDRVRIYSFGMLESGPHAQHINIAGLPNGSYFYQIISSGKKGQGRILKIP